MTQERWKPGQVSSAPKLHGTGVMFLMLVAVMMASAAACGGRGRTTVASGSDWATYGLDYSNSVNNRAEITLSANNVGDLVEVWRAETGGVTAHAEAHGKQAQV